jgi:8-hydroxy-5-deazaflavin:NADPH oxidoreductase
MTPVHPQPRRIAVVGAGRIGGNLARLLSAAGREVAISFSRDPDALAAKAADLGVRADHPASAVRSADIVVLSVPWGLVDEAIEQAGGPEALAGRIVVDTTNQFGRVDGRFGVLDLGGRSASQHNAAKVPGARWAKAFNTLTAGFQASAAGRTGSDRVVMFHAADDDDTATTVAELITDSGFAPVRTGTLDRHDVGHQEPKGDLYGEEFHLGDALAAVERLRGTEPSGRGRP